MSEIDPDKPIPLKPTRGLKVTIEEDDGIQAATLDLSAGSDPPSSDKDVSTFMDLLVDGEVDEEEIDHFVGVWHSQEEYTEPLHDFLGMYWWEYRQWVEDPKCLPRLAEKRRKARHESEESFAVELHSIWKCMGCGKDFMTDPGEKPVCPRCNRG